jgi:hypothetical protein
LLIGSRTSSVSGRPFWLCRGSCFSLFSSSDFLLLVHYSHSRCPFHPTNRPSPLHQSKLHPLQSAAARRIITSHFPCLHLQLSSPISQPPRAPSSLQRFLNNHHPHRHSLISRDSSDVKTRLFPVSSGLSKGPEPCRPLLHSNHLVCHQPHTQPLTSPLVLALLNRVWTSPSTAAAACFSSISIVRSIY